MRPSRTGGGLLLFLYAAKSGYGLQSSLLPVPWFSTAARTSLCHRRGFPPRPTHFHATTDDIADTESVQAESKGDTRPQDMRRRSLLTEVCKAAVVTGASSLGLIAGGPQPAYASFDGAQWPLWPALPLAPYGKRKTIRREASPNKVWVFDQMFGVFYVHVPIRMTVVAMQDGKGLFVYAPVAPTKECLRLLQPLIQAHGPVKYIVLPSVAPEHKVLAGPFARKFPEAEFYTTNAQYSFPLNLPTIFLGFPGNPKPLPASSEGQGELWGGEFEHEILTVKASKNSIYQDAAFFHKPSGTLMVCDAIVSTSPEPPAILTSEPEYVRALLYHARDDPLELVKDTPEVRRKGWQRIVLFANFFMPGSLINLENDVWLAAAPKSPMPELGWAGVLPFTWRESTTRAFEAFSDDGKPTVAPIIQIILSRNPEATKQWIDKICTWRFDKVIPAHFDAPLGIGPEAFRGAFGFITAGKNEVRFCDEDVAFIRDQIDGLEATPDLALYKTPLGSLKGKDCRLV